MNLFIKSLFSLSFALFVVVTSVMAECNYFVNSDNTIADNSNSGTSEDQAWLTLAHVNLQMQNQILQPGDEVCFKRGSVWRETLIITQSGQANNSLTFSTYGEGNNPLILTTDQLGWWQESIAFGGFEYFDNDVIDYSNRIFIWPWYNNTWPNTSISADPDNSFFGNYAAKLSRLTDEAKSPILRMFRTLTQQQSYYLRFYAKTNGSVKFSVSLRDDRQISDLWLQPNRTWGDTAAAILSDASVDYKMYNLSFTTLADAGPIDIRFSIQEGVGDLWLDEVVLFEGNAEPAEKRWHGHFVDTTTGKIYGLQDKGKRIPTLYRPTNSGVIELSNRQATSKGNSILYRRDDGDLSDIEVGHRTNAILVSGQSYIVIDGIDAKGAIARGRGLGGESGLALIFISPGSSNVTVKNLQTSQTSGSGVSSGIYQYMNNPTEVRYENLISNDNETTGLYLRGSGYISNSQVYDIALLADDTGDRGAIGIQQGPVIIQDNELFNIGRGDKDIDFVISICCGIEGQVIVRRNYLHDFANGGIQIIGNSQSFNHIVNHNIIHRFGQNNTPNTAYGKFAGIRLRDVPGTKIYNNIFSHGGSVNAYGILLWDDVSDLEIKNNIFFNNQSPDIGGVYNLVTNGWSSNNNIYFRQDNPAGNWWWEGTTYSDLDSWTQISGQDTESLQADPKFSEQSLDSATSFAVTIDSPAIDTGKINTEIVADFLNLTIQAPAEIGAFEYRPTTEVSDPDDGVGTLSWFSLLLILISLITKNVITRPIPEIRKGRIVSKKQFLRSLYRKMC